MGVNNIEFCHFWWGEKAYCSGLVTHTKGAAGDFHQKIRADHLPAISVVCYEDGNRWQMVSANFLVEITSGTLGVSNETTAVGFFSPPEMAELDIVDPHIERIQDFLAGQEAAFFR